MAFTIRRTPFTPRPDGFIDQAFLEDLSNRIGDDWIRLADYLNVRRIRIQALNIDRANKNPAMDVLMTWIKRMPRSANKLSILMEALSSCGRRDLSNMLMERRNDERKKSPLYSKEARLERAIRTISAYSHLIYDWHLLCQRLNISDDVIQSLQNRYNNTSNRCHRAITYWAEMSGGGCSDDVGDEVISLKKITTDEKAN
ncbi:hypothetical protein HELRODRAFT_168775 [Helobdella robusta]|uniref:Death domain-containing protein n=1 Tax=Helobdella robusta TaxID=6412 RepID=T1F0Y2_HELRO|nr:hypothetical protein HELRODRAFT_168775 [Helobdella robusta]ESO08860.1 hypothetical protein HELRODRAFT_168775 [Helobdella robusta]